jgi:hypothetical protein
MTGLRAVGTPIQATPSLHGLIASAQEVTDPDRWEAGFTICPENCVDLSGFVDDCFADGKPADFSLADAPPNQDCYDVLSFVVESSFKCNAHGFQTVDYRGRARRQLEAGTSKFIEHELWTGTLQPTNPHLTDMSTLTVIPGVHEPDVALALLGSALSGAAHGGRGMIHAPTLLVDTWLNDSSNLIREQGNKLATVNRGDTIVSGTGYPGSGPDNAAASWPLVWAYATGPVQFRLGPVIVTPDTMAQAMDRRRNVVEYGTQRDAAVNFDPCAHFGIQIDLSTVAGS